MRVMSSAIGSGSRNPGLSGVQVELLSRVAGDHSTT
jgi:hypothetical protein